MFQRFFVTPDRQPVNVCLTHLLGRSFHVAVACALVWTLAGNVCAVALGQEFDLQIPDSSIEVKPEPAAVPAPKPDEPKADQPKAAEEKKPEEQPKPAESKPAEEGLKPLTRPQKPAQAPDPKELEIRPDEQGKVRFNFHGQPWQGVLEWLAEISDMSLDWQELPGDYLNLKTQRAYTVAEARDLVNRHLLDRGYTLLRNGEVLTVVNTKKLDPSLIPRVRPEELVDRDPHEFAKVTLPLDWLLAETTIEELKPLLSPNGKLTALKATNRLEVVDAVTNLRDIQTLLREEQSNNSRKRLVKPFRLKHVRAEDVKRHLQGLLGLAEDPIAAAAQAASESSGPELIGQIQALQQAQAAAMQAAQAAAATPGAPRPPKVNMIINSRENTLLVHAQADQLAIIAEAIDVLDQPSENPSLLQTMSRMRVYRLTNIDPEPVVKMLRELGGFDPATRVQVDKKNRSLIVHGVVADHLIVRQLLDKLDGSERRFEVVRLRKLEADYVAGTIEFMMEGGAEQEQQGYNPFIFYYGQNDAGKKKNKFRVDADIENNRLLLWANEIELAEVEKLLVKLGEIPAAGGEAARSRVIESISPEEAAEFLKRLQRAWPGIAPNPLKIEIPADTEVELDESEIDPAQSPPRRGPARQRPAAQRPSRPAGDQITMIRRELAPKRTPVGESKSRVLQVNAERQASARSDRRLAADTQIAEIDEPPLSAIDTTPAEANPAGSRPGPKGLQDADPRFADEPGWESLSEPPAAGFRGRRTPPSRGVEGAPVRVFQGPDGRLVIESEDTDALDALEEMVSRLTPVRRDFKVFKMKYSSTWAWSVANNLKDFFSEKDKEKRNRDGEYFGPWFGGMGSEKKDERRRLSKRRPLKFISDTDSNSIIVTGADPQQLQIIQELIDLYDVPDSKDSKAMRITRMFQIRYAKARGIAESIKEVYRDLLSENDPALAGKGEGDKGKRPAPSMVTYVLGGDGSDDGSEKPKNPIKLKGMLSIGVEDVSNTLIVSAAEGMMRELEKIIETLDEAARPTVSRVHVMQMGRQVNVGVVQERMQKLLKRADPPPQQQGQQPQPQQPQPQPAVPDPSVMVIE